MNLVVLKADWLAASWVHWKVLHLDGILVVRLAVLLAVWMVDKMVVWKVCLLDMQMVASKVDD